MPIQALLLVFAAAVMHTAWNYLVKTVTDKQIFTWWTLVVGWLLYVPLILIDWPIPPVIWPYAIISALVETTYFIVLIRAYEHGDFSLVYPIARGAAPAMIAVWALLFLGEQPGAWGAAGLSVLIIGLTIVGGAGIITGRKNVRVSIEGVSAALFLSLCISVYSTIDAAAVRIMPARSYAFLVLAITAVFLAPVIFSRFEGRAVLAGLRKHPVRIAVVAFIMPVAYFLVLGAYELTKVSYVAAGREVSVIIAALAGWLLMGEEFGPVRTAGAALIFFGIILIAVAG